MRTSYHNHTLFSDGKCDPVSMAEGAVRAGVDELGIADHLTLHPEGRAFPWAMPPERLEEYREAVLSAGTAGVTMRLGLEVDYFPGMESRLDTLLGRYPFDYLIGSVHFLNDFILDLPDGPGKPLSAEQRRGHWDLYWTRVAQMARSRLFDVAGHLDLPKRNGWFDERTPSPEALRALDALAEAGMAVEINTSGYFLPSREAYPGPGLLEEVRRRGIPVLATADAHQAEHLTRGFDRALELAREAGFSEWVRYEKRRRFSLPF